MTRKGRFLVAALLVLLMAGQAFAYELLSGPTGTTYWDKKKAFNGYTLYYPDSGTNTYLVDMQGNVVNIWPGVGNPMLTDDGYLFGIYGNRHDYGDLVLMDWKGKIVKKWIAPGQEGSQYPDGILSSDGYHKTLFHHDWKIVEKLDGSRSVFTIARVYRTKAEIAAGGFSTSSGGKGGGSGLSDTDAILEFDMDGNLIWQWEFWDRYSQNYKTTGTHYLNYTETPYGKLHIPSTKNIGSDADHCNSIDYNPVRDEVLINPVAKGSFYVMNHATTTEQARGEMGDFIYRWGEMSQYNSTYTIAGIKYKYDSEGNIVSATYGKNDSQIKGAHNVQWIDEGLPGEGNFLVFHNAGDPFNDAGSAVVEINPYTKDAFTFNGPRDYWKTAPYVRQEEANLTVKGFSDQLVTYFVPSRAYGGYELTGFYSGHISGLQRLPNGNTLVCSGEPGHFFEITPTVSNDRTEKLFGRNSDVAWEFVNPYALPRSNDVKKINAARTAGEKPVIPSYASYLEPILKKDPNADIVGQLWKHRPAGVDGQVFRCLRYAPNFKGFKGKKLKAQGPLNDPKKWGKSFKGFGFGGSITGGAGGVGGGATGGMGTGY